MSDMRTDKGQEVSLDTAVFAGGCFWHMEDAFQKLDGVSTVYAGYTGGVMKDPTYQQVISHATDHLEAVEVHYNPKVITYNELLQQFWKNASPAEAAIFYTSTEQMELAEASRKDAAKRIGNATKITAATTFYKAEEEHQDYYERHGMACIVNKVFRLGR
ncbi:peptide-methionine (S)-S-oxide reductase MsrA [Paenibacillus sp. CF384]|uniref:peptide-methionine (S)-S-oxide reductase MsrA n=1 Tax=Paenibacillus sp. CF384 TaxID=1884382 RepID=UPI00089C4926|nr:peptide-methionine (S)-S-oxide reductase MsrA [Paenibacillus sp. CF384]SDW47019.1 peptide-methionine (S)-S-oxide reductase/peptide methionine sulfoxide reductase msrA/msrB [Paenibacillus sp. CF384]